jgi:Cu/Ag efflux protein CusF
MNDMGEMVMTKGVISRIDTQNGKVGIKHEAIANLKMPPMTMVFGWPIRPCSGSEGGDAVRFHAENPAGKLTVTAIQKQ